MSELGGEALRFNSCVCDSPIHGPQRVAGREGFNLQSDTPGVHPEQGPVGMVNRPGRSF